MKVLKEKNFAIISDSKAIYNTLYNNCKLPFSIFQDNYSDDIESIGKLDLLIIDKDIDPQKLPLYRINTNWKKIIKNAKTFINAGGDARWDMLVFAHNEHQVDDCEKMSKQLGFKGFSIKHTTRFKDGKFDVLDDNYNITHTLLPSSKSLEMIEPAKQAMQEILPTITCKAKQDNQMYISANGNVSPCCWLDLEWIPQHSAQRIDYMVKMPS